jgi:hypothetical protein
MERKVEYNYNFKLRCVNEVLIENRTATSATKKNNLTRDRQNHTIDIMRYFYSYLPINDSYWLIY